MLQSKNNPEIIGCPLRGGSGAIHVHTCVCFFTSVEVRDQLLPLYGLRLNQKLALLERLLEYGQWWYSHLSWDYIKRKNNRITTRNNPPRPSECPYSECHQLMNMDHRLTKEVCVVPHPSHYPLYIVSMCVYNKRLRVFHPIKCHSLTNNMCFYATY